MYMCMSKCYLNCGMLIYFQQTFRCIQSSLIKVRIFQNCLRNRIEYIYDISMCLIKHIFVQCKYKIQHFFWFNTTGLEKNRYMKYQSYKSRFELWH